MEYLIIAVKAIAVYVFIIAAIVFLGKKEITQSLITDLVATRSHNSYFITHNCHQ